uniref:Gustatory receptor n=1 Tax=Anopheles triannulatus TaxID=58253 RepID=A0A2M4AYU8_9DIPT
MSSYYQRHSRFFQFCSFVYLVPCNYNPRTDRFEETLSNRIRFAIFIAQAIPFWFYDLKLTTAMYLENITPIMVTVGTIEIIVYVSIIGCTLLNVFCKRRHIAKLMNVLFRSDWLLDQFDTIEQRYDQNRTITLVVLVLIMLSCVNLYNIRETHIWTLTLNMTLKMFGVSLLTLEYRIFVSAIGMRMEQLKQLLEVHRNGHLQERDILRDFIARYDLYVDQIRLVNRCFSFPITVVLLLVLLELVYLLFDCYTILVGRGWEVGVDKSYAHWLMRQTWQMIYAGVLLLLANACQCAKKKVSSDV